MTIHFGDNTQISSFATIAASKLTGALPAISGASLTNLPVKVQEATSTGETQTNSTVNSTKLSLGVGTASNTRVMLFFGFAIKNSDGSDNQRTYGEFNASNATLVGGNYDVSTTGGYLYFHDQRLDISSHSGTRTYRIQFRKSSGNTGFIKDAYICAIAFQV